MKIIENKSSIDFMEVKEMQLREYERLQEKEKTEVAFQANRQANKKFKGQEQEQEQEHHKGKVHLGYQSRSYRNERGRFKGRCFKCHTLGTKNKTAPIKKIMNKYFTHCQSQYDWLMDGGTSSHKTYNHNIFDS